MSGVFFGFPWLSETDYALAQPELTRYFEKLNRTVHEFRKGKPVHIAQYHVECICPDLAMALGVYLGFLATDISEDRKRAELKRNFAASMLNEISVNEAGISSRIDYHRMLRDSTRSLLRNFNIKTISISFFQGIRMRDLTDGAYLTGIQTGAISEFEISDIQLINQVYTSQKGYNSLLSMTLNNLLGMDFAYDEAHLKRVLNFLTMVMADVVIQEEKLLMEYKELRTLLEKNSPDLSAGTNVSSPDSLNSVR